MESTISKVRKVIFMENVIYVTHTCKNSKLPPKVKANKKLGIKEIKHDDYCFCAFMDVDKYNAKTNPPAYKYCQKCEKKGYKNPKIRIFNNFEEREALSKRLEKNREVIKQNRLCKSTNTVQY
jgi:hypothetical protein